MPGILYIVATPIGNLEDITFRAVKVLKEVDLILAEDTRVASKLLNHYDIKNNILSYHQHTSDKTKFFILNELISGKNLALITDAGTPSISDPGNELIDFICRNSDLVKIVPVPGPSALTAAISISGFKTNKFVFLGFLPKKNHSGLLKWLKEGGLTFAFYESPKRILKTLDLLLNFFGEEKRVVVARELTKVYETIYRGSFKEVKEKLEGGKLKGELVVVVEAD